MKLHTFLHICISIYMLPAKCFPYNSADSGIYYFPGSAAIGSMSGILSFTDLKPGLMKSMCVTSLILIGCCVSELHDHLCVHCNV